MMNVYADFAEDFIIPVVKESKRKQSDLPEQKNLLH
jgi:hypothetical protein